jgi:ankyrin repeat protein
MILLDHRANPKIARSDGALAADIAKQNGHEDVRDLIRQLGKYGTPFDQGR